MNLIELRQVLGSFVTGVTVVTTKDTDGAPRGFTANSFTSVSLDPPLILVCVGQSAASYPAFKSCDTFAVNILCDNQRDLSSTFARKGSDKFSSVDWRWSASDAPIFEGVLGWLDCHVHQRFDVGDHLLLIGRIHDFGMKDEVPLGYFRGRYAKLEVSDRMEAGLKQGVILGCLATYEDRIFLCRDRDGGEWRMPLNSHPSTGLRGRAALLAHIASFGTDVDLNFLYSVWEWDQESLLYLIYRGVLRHEPAVHVAHDIEGRLFQPQELPWDDINILFQDMLRRFLKEKDSDSFGVFAELEKEGGTLALLGKQPSTMSYQDLQLGRNCPT